MHERTAVLGPALLADGPAADRAAKMMLYGQFVGSWGGTVVVHNTDGTPANPLPRSTSAGC